MEQIDNKEVSSSSETSGYNEKLENSNKTVLCRLKIVFNIKIFSLLDLMKITLLSAAINEFIELIKSLFKG
ncbi:MAG: hypothetical protein E7B11_26950 [Clostridiales bacterium]|nr:hypothetical protein [Clostridiales bacterium]